MLPTPLLAAGELEFITKMVENALYLLALLNPVSKVMFLSSYDPPLDRRHIFELAWKSSLAALVILIILAGAGDLLLTVPAGKAEDGALMLVEYRGERMVRKVLKLDGGRTQLQAFDHEFSAVVGTPMDTKVLGRCVKLERKL